MVGLVPTIHACDCFHWQDVGARDKPEHDGVCAGETVSARSHRDIINQPRASQPRCQNHAQRAITRRLDHGE